MTAQRRSPIKKVPARNGRLRRDIPMPWAPCRIVVIATVASKPQIIILQNDGRPVTDIGSPVWLTRRQCERRVDQANMGERLGKVAEGSSSLGINLLREQSDVVGEGKNALER